MTEPSAIPSPDADAMIWWLCGRGREAVAATLIDAAEAAAEQPQIAVLDDLAWTLVTKSQLQVLSTVTQTAWEQALGPAVTLAIAGYTVRPVGEPAQQAEHTPSPSLSDREEAVLQLAGRGYSNAEIAAQLAVSVNTVKFHLSSVYAKLGVHNRTEAVGKSQLM